jgi:hypothetical protein
MNKRNNLEKRLAAYGSMSLALAAVSMPAAAQAGSVTYTPDLNTSNSPDGAIYFNIDPNDKGYSGYTSDGPGDFELRTSVSAFTNSNNQLESLFKARLEVGPGFSANGNQFVASASVGGYFSSIAKLNQGASIGPALTFSSNNGTLAENTTPAYGRWNGLAESGYLGLRMPSGPSSYIYGWANITVNSDYSITLNSFGYADAPDEAVVAPDPTPEPASIVLLALGAAGIAAWRRKTAAAR